MRVLAWGIGRGLNKGSEVVVCSDLDSTLLETRISALSTVLPQPLLLLREDNVHLPAPKDSLVGTVDCRSARLRRTRHTCLAVDALHPDPTLPQSLPAPGRPTSPPLAHPCHWIRSYQSTSPRVLSQAFLMAQSTTSSVRQFSVFGFKHPLRSAFSVS